MGRKSKIRAIKRAWIDKEKRIISFSCLPNADDYRAEEPAFWQEIVLLMKSGYRVQKNTSPGIAKTAIPGTF